MTITQPAPIAHDGPTIPAMVQADLRAELTIDGHPLPDLELIVADIAGRDIAGRDRVGRDALRDAYEEALDLCQYLRQAIAEGLDMQHVYGMALLTAYQLRLELSLRERPTSTLRAIVHEFVAGVTASMARNKRSAPADSFADTTAQEARR